MSKSTKKLTLKNFIYRASKIHNNKFNYSKSIYINVATKIEIICPKHGSFFQKPNDHLNGVGCCKCGIERRTKLRTSNVTEFINKSKKIHKDKFDYSKFIYINTHTKGIIICQQHGKFYQSANCHL